MESINYFIRDSLSKAKIFQIYWTKFDHSSHSERSSNSIWLNALLHLLTHNDFYPALVGEQTLTRSVILHNNYQEKQVLLSR